MSYLVDRNGVIRHRVFGYFASPTLRLAAGRLLEEEAVAGSAAATAGGVAGQWAPDATHRAQRANKSP